ncbi:hypothetical protein NQ315_014098 [Exocentrus adspersus]|uniref:Uncharacterized protein n=1 Tax=Exocentrus adspersus TaxID=1586481 RepID=A0AAV8VVG4_9CUCU|nr:hypothetical protein NQ315_014098 [Exocentrus adspersus]
MNDSGCGNPDAGQFKRKITKSIKEQPIMHVGAGIYLESNGVQQSYSLGSYATVFQAEVFTILMVAQRKRLKTVHRKGSSSARTARQLSKNKIKACSGVRRCPGVFSQAGVGGACLGHMGISRNEKAHQLARLWSGGTLSGAGILGISRGSINVDGPTEE